MATAPATTTPTTPAVNPIQSELDSVISQITSGNDPYQIASVGDPSTPYSTIGMQLQQEQLAKAVLNYSNPNNTGPTIWIGGGQPITADNPYYSYFSNLVSQNPSDVVTRDVPNPSGHGVIPNQTVLNTSDQFSIPVDIGTPASQWNQAHYGAGVPNGPTITDPALAEQAGLDYWNSQLQGNIDKTEGTISDITNDLKNESGFFHNPLNVFSLALPFLGPVGAAVGAVTSAAMAGRDFSNGDDLGGLLSAISAVGSGLSAGGDVFAPDLVDPSGAKILNDLGLSQAAPNLVNQIGQGVNTAGQAASLGAAVSQGNLINALGAAGGLAESGLNLANVNPISSISSSLGLDGGVSPTSDFDDPNGSNYPSVDPVGNVGVAFPSVGSEPISPTSDFGADPISSPSVVPVGPAGTALPTPQASPSNLVSPSILGSVQPAVLPPPNTNTASSPGLGSDLLKVALAVGGPLLAADLASPSSAGSIDPAATTPTPVTSPVSAPFVPNASGTALDLESIFNPAQAGYSPPTGGESSWLMGGGLSEGQLINSPKINFGDSFGQSVGTSMSGNMNGSNRYAASSGSGYEAVLRELGLAA